MDYSAERRKLHEAILKLDEDETKELMKTFPNIIGQCYKLNNTKLIKITKIRHIYSLTHAAVDGIIIDVRKNNSNVMIDTNDCVEIDIAPGEYVEVTNQEFNNHFGLAMNAISLLLTKD
jgi:hypothetical protein